MAERVSGDDIERLKALVEAHQVCYEVWAEFLMVSGERRKVGFELQLFGVHDHPEEQVTAGCRHCSHTYRDLLQIAEWIMPKETRPSRYDVEPFDYSLRETPKRKFRPEVALSVKILHRHGFDQPVDECEERCLKEMRQSLAELGVPQGEWRKSRASTHKQDGET